MNNLLELANNINEAFERSKQFYESGIEALSQAVTSDKEVGELLLKAKVIVPHGEFMQWVEANCKFKMRHAQKLMQVANNWEKIVRSWEDAKCATRGAFDSPLPSLRVAIALVSTEPKPEAPPPEPTTKYKVGLPSHPCYGEVVEVKGELHKGDVIVCKTSQGEIPFLKKELIPASQSLEKVDTEIIDVEIENISEQLKEAIAIVIEYLPESELKAVLAAAVSIGKDFLPVDAQGMVSKLIGSQETPALNGSSFA
ncbi:MAG: DUF3102 domain-containing protein [Desmonostoc geniculatum HA4340-LM1]|jgi:hypothetical protein|nr:DUF3102 domain-containing protein [Desmonostoc geniculatum HA4340-LM1]